MRRRTTLLAWARSVTLLAGLGAPCLAQAADLLPPPPPPPMAPPIVEVGGGWYLRGDAGASFYDSPGYSSIDSPPSHYYGGRADTGWFAGAGIGYEFNGFLRGDITGEYRTTGLRTSSYSDFGFSGCDGLGCYYQQGRTTNLSAGRYEGAVFLANGYFDLGTFYGVTPFVGGGVGVAFNNLTGFTDSGSTVTQTTYQSGQIVNGGGVSAGGTFKDKGKTNFAWALHAGFAFAVSHNLKLEVGYRYINLGQASTGVLNCFCGQTFSPMKVKDLDAHEVKVGLRYLLGGAAPLPPMDYPPPGPLVRKY